MATGAEIIIQNGKTLYEPVVHEDIQWSTERFGEPGKLTFKVVYDSKLKIEEGNAVRFKWNGHKIFFGFIFTIKIDKVGKIATITAYDQLRYFKNKDTYVYANKTAGAVIKMIAKDFAMQCGSIADTKYKIPSRVEDNKTLFDIIQNALDVTLENKKKMYVMYDNFGKITLKSLEDMKTNILIDKDTALSYDYSSTIDSNTYNKVKLVFDNDKTKKRDVYIAQSSKNMNKWGVLQLYETLQEGENGKAKADALLKLYNSKTRKLTIKTLGSVKVRAGSMVVVMLSLGDKKLCNYMLVESCKHTFKLNEHTMELHLRGGEFTGE